MKATPVVEGKYRVIYADPPWKYGGSMNETYGTADKHYPTLTLTEICELPIIDLAEDNAVLFLWTTSPMLEDAFKVINTWGFTYKASFI
ncbi:MAG: MT-A70 family methyltransferase, partial [Dehalococcoidia bacterium]|nr:MT-A70 family methyltransferase [Dehalococcoidia bacterium]